VEVALYLQVPAIAGRGVFCGQSMSYRETRALACFDHLSSIPNDKQTKAEFPAAMVALVVDAPLAGKVVHG